jgi:hypothetical protein
MDCRRTIGLLLLIGLALWGCSGVQTPSNAVWIAQPEFLVVENQLLKTRLEPKKGEYAYYDFFLLTLTNKSNANLIIDWNASQYLFNNKPQGVLVFEGIDPAAVKKAMVSPQTVAPGAVFSIGIMPMRLIAWSPIEEESASRRGISPGIFPAGENAIRLVVRHENEQITIPLSVRISKENAP